MTQLDRAKVILASDRLEKLKNELTDLMDGKEFETLHTLIFKTNKIKPSDLKALRNNLFAIRCKLDDDILTNKLFTVLQILED